jgi:hypothetical protein
MRTAFCIFLLSACTAFAGQQTPAPGAATSTPVNPASANPPTGGAPAPSAAPVAATPSQPPTPDTLLDGTPVKLRLSQTVSSADAKVGQEIPFEVVEDVQTDGVTVLSKGATAIATVTEAQPKRRMGRGGKLNMNISYARLANQQKVALRAVKEAQGGGHVGAMTGAIVATSIVFFPAAPLFLFMHGKDITIPQGTEITAFVDGDMHLDMAKFGAPPPAPPSTEPKAQAALNITSSPPGADIEMDGGFVGNTPSTIDISPGSHEITLRKTGFADWTRKLNVTGGNIDVNAALEPNPATPPPAPPSGLSAQPE